MKIFVEPVASAVALLIERLGGGACERPLSIFGAQPNSNEPIRELVRTTVQGHELTRTSWAFHLKIVAIVIMKFLQRFDEQVINRHPNRSAPVRITAE